ncbi:MAG TPA: lasso peptide biosynthesis B2 protein [Vicinamibacterales bacterium]|nr:lasso peptide biosynthesis B2 protein [Vicinamibacterales bacterium]
MIPQPHAFGGRNGVHALNDGVYWCHHGGIVVVLSMNSGRYTTLDPLASMVWIRACEGDALDRIVEHVRSERLPTPDVAELEATISELIEAFCEKGLLRAMPATGGPPEPTTTLGQAAPRSTTASPRAKAPRVPSVIECCVLLACARIALRVLRLRKVLAYLWRTRREISCVLNERWLQALARNLAIAQAISPIHTACLEQSLTAWWCLNRAGAEAHLRLGAQPFPFNAHAWVEHRGTPVVDDPEHLREFRAFPPIDFARL